jgi:acetamidase/formamidase
LVAGTVLYLPVHTSGALFEVGDGHAGQGNGEVDVTALEPSLTGTLEFVLHKATKQTYPRAETPTHFIAMGFDDNLSVAAQKAVREMIEFLVADKKLSRDDAYMLISVAGDLAITQIVDRNKGVHVMLPKDLFVKQ